MNFARWERTAINDELAARLGFEDIAGLREAVAGQINGQHATALRQALKKNVLDSLADGDEFDVPPSLYASEYENVARAMNSEPARKPMTRIRTTTTIMIIRR
jgi:trigger factor